MCMFCTVTKSRGLSEQKMLPKKKHSICQRFLKCSTIVLISLIYGSHENSNKNGKAGEAKIGAFMSHLRWPVLFLSKNEIYFV
ncbi:Non-reducing polyketide synthase pkdA [Trichinella spiralis]|uniref:Non-reducing polyketide synthase pkdA n=1 Tax=Trichinella spiralis TaxID=6334 RepID=A0ABR3K3T0_TRISP